MKPDGLWIWQFAWAVTMAQGCFRLADLPDCLCEEWWKSKPPLETQMLHLQSEIGAEMKTDLAFAAENKPTIEVLHLSAV